MARTDVAVASNARVAAPVVEYERDPRGVGLFRRLSGAHAATLGGRGARPVVEVNGWWHGAIHASPQRFLGLAHLGNARPVAERSADLGETRSAGLEDPAQRLFRDREARRRR